MNECSGYRMHWEHECSCGLRMDAPVIGCTRKTSVIRVWAWMPWLSDALRTRTLLLFLVVIACTESANVIMVFGMDALVIGCTDALVLGCTHALGTRTLWFGQEVSGALGVFGQQCATTPIPPQTPQGKAQNPRKTGYGNPPACIYFQ